MQLLPEYASVSYLCEASSVAQILSNAISTCIQAPFVADKTENMNLTRYQAVVGDMLSLLDVLLGECD